MCEITMDENNKTIEVNDSIELTDTTTGLTDEQIDKIAEEAAETRPPIDMEEIRESVEVNEDAELEAVEAYIGPNGVGIAVPADNFNTVDILGDEEINDNTIENMSTTAGKEFDLTEEEIAQFYQLMQYARSDPKKIRYDLCPKKFKDMIDNIMASSNIPRQNVNAVTREFIGYLFNEYRTDEAFTDLEKSLKEALNIPNISDMQSEYTQEVFDVELPKVVESLKETDPAKAELLLRLQELYHLGLDFSLAKETYEKDARLRKAIRRNDLEYKRTIEEFNLKNEKSNFMMPDAFQLEGALHSVLMEEPHKFTRVNLIPSEDEMLAIPPSDKVYEMATKIIDMNITDTDIQKFIILILRSCINMDPTSLEDATYMFYLVRDLIVLTNSGGGKTDFSLELINNVCSTIAFIRSKEEEFYASNMDKPKPRKKRD